MSNQDTDKITFSFVAPVHNEQEGLKEFYSRLTAVADELGEPYEIIFVNDGSEDGTEEILCELVNSDRRVKVVEFSRNFGHQIALTAGYDHAAGRAVISLDSDCQHPPELIPQLVSKWREGYEVVYTVRENTEGISPLRRTVGRLAYRLIRMACGVDLTDQADFRLLDHKALRALNSVREKAHFLRGLTRWIGFRQIAIPYVAEQRAAGQSSYTLKQMVQLATAGMFNFSLRPLRMIPLFAAMLLVVVVVYAIVSLVLWPMGLAAGPWWHLFMAMVGFCGLQLLILGVLGEYIGRIFEEARDRPLYVMRKTLGFGDKIEDQFQADQEASQADNEEFSVYT